MSDTCILLVYRYIVNIFAPGGCMYTFGISLYCKYIVCAPMLRYSTQSWLFNTQLFSSL